MCPSTICRLITSNLGTDVDHTCVIRMEWPITALVLFGNGRIFEMQCAGANVRDVGLQAARRLPYQRYLPKAGQWRTSQDNNVHRELTRSPC
jgi:hypothetical protein